MTAKSEKPARTTGIARLNDKVGQVQSGRYIEATGRRKTSTARVRITPASKFSATVNGRTFEDYFALPEYKKSILAALADTGDPKGQAYGAGKFQITAKITGGGASSQAGAMRHGLARALVAMDPELRTKLKTKGYLKRDPRAKERRKFGLKKARKAPQWSKR